LRASTVAAGNFLGILTGGVPGILNGVVPGVRADTLGGFLIGVDLGRRIVPRNGFKLLILQGEGRQRQSGGEKVDIGHKNGLGGAPKPCSTLR